MTGYWFASATVIAMLTNGALAQSPSDAANSTQPSVSINGAAGTYDSTKTTRSNDAKGVQTDATETFDKSQTYTSGNNELSAGTRIRSGTTTVITPSPPPVSTTTTTTTTTTQEVRP